MSWLVDLDGVVWRGNESIAGAAGAVARLRAEGERVVFLTNNSSPTIAEYLDKLERHGLPTAAEDLITSAQAAAALVDPEATALVCAGGGVEEALAARGVRTVREGPADVVVVGWHRDFDFERLTAACRAIWAGARLVATNADSTYPAPDGLLPGGGAILAAVTTATGAVPKIAGKPHGPIADLARQRVPDASLVVGDRLDTDGELARRLELPFALVLTGVTAVAPAAGIADQIAPDLATLVERRFLKAHPF